MFVTPFFQKKIFFHLCLCLISSHSFTCVAIVFRRSLVILLRSLSFSHSLDEHFSAQQFNLNVLNKLELVVVRFVSYLHYSLFFCSRVCLCVCLLLFYHIPSVCVLGFKRPRKSTTKTVANNVRYDNVTRSEMRQRPNTHTHTRKKNCIHRFFVEKSKPA